MSVLTPPEIIGEVPLEMFSELASVIKQHVRDMESRLGLDLNDIRCTFNISEQSTYTPTNERIRGILSPLVNVIYEFEGRAPDSLYFDISSGIVRPKHVQRGDGR